MDLDLERLLELDLYLNAMGITGIHHTHLEGEWMVGVQSSFMGMRGIMDGSHDVDRSEVLGTYMVTPTKMTMEMHMIDVMYAPSDDWTLMAMVPLMRSSMEHRTAGGVRFKTRSSGIGDIQMSGLYNLWRRDSEEATHRIVAKFGMTLPTGTINAKDDTPMGRVTLPYPMQLGSGTFDMLPGLTYLGQSDDWAWGSHVGADVRFHENRRDYQLGNRGEWTAWTARKLAKGASVSLRLAGKVWGNIHGADSRLNPMMVPTADSDLRAGRRLDLLLGFNAFDVSGPLKGHRLVVEGGIPLYQSLDGPQLKTSWTLRLNWYYTFGR